MGCRKILEGNKINNLYIEKYIGNNKYECKCTLCGNTRICRSYELKLGKYRACKECEVKANGKNGKAIDLTGQKFGYWTCLRRDESNGKYWWCQCGLCGRTFKVLAANMKKGLSSSCIECSNKLRQDNTPLQKTYELGEVIRRLEKDMWECKCGLCSKSIVRSGTKLKTISKIVCNNCHGELHREDLTGKIIGNWQVLEYEKNTENYHSKYKCKCLLCGKITSVFTYNLTSEHSKSCGCQNFIDLAGKKLNEWTVIEYCGNQMWKCRCSCGKIGYIHGYELRSGKAKSCGCKKWEYAKNTMLKKYGDIAPSHIKNPRTPEQIAIIESKENFEKFLKTFENKPTTYEVSKSIGIQPARTLAIIHKYNLEDYVDIDSRHSKQEIEILKVLCNYIDKSEIVLGDRTVLNGKELDIYIPKFKLAIEVNGSYWHSTIFKDSRYHQDKTIDCAKKGIRLIHIFEYEWEDDEKREKIISILASALNTERNRIVYARNTVIKVVDNEQAELFLNRYHLQGYTRAQITLGCYYENELLGVMSFGHPRFNSNYQYELIRLSWKSGVRVVGGLEKLFKQFVTEYNPESILTYCDIAKFTGNSYTRIGFKPLSEKPITSPNYVWLDADTNETLTRYQTQKATLVKLGLGSENETEDEIMYRQGFLKIHDCGNLRLEWKREQA